MAGEGADPVVAICNCRNPARRKAVPDLRDLAGCVLCERDRVVVPVLHLKQLQQQSNIDLAKNAHFR